MEYFFKKWYTMVNTVTVNSKGMITIPKDIREKYHLEKGTDVAVIDIEGNITIIPILSKDELDKTKTLTVEELARIYEKSREDELEIENS